MDDRVRKKKRATKGNLARKLDDQVEQIVYKVMTNEGLEQTISRAIKKALVELVVRYFVLIGFLVLLVLSMQVLMFIVIIKQN